MCHRAALRTRARERRIDEFFCRARKFLRKRTATRAQRANEAMVCFVHRAHAAVQRQGDDEMNAWQRIALAPVLAAAMFAAAPAFAGNNSDQPVTDTWITTKVKSELMTTSDVKSMNVDVKTVNGVVTLTGTLANELAVQKAVTAAKSVKGVKNVDASGLKAGGGAQ
jgi:hyperosmotically inducible protein